MAAQLSHRGGWPHLLQGTTAWPVSGSRVTSGSRPAGPLPMTTGCSSVLGGRGGLHRRCLDSSWGAHSSPPERPGRRGTDGHRSALRSFPSCLFFGLALLCPPWWPHSRAMRGYWTLQGVLSPVPSLPHRSCPGRGPLGPASCLLSSHRLPFAANKTTHLSPPTSDTCRCVRLCPRDSSKNGCRGLS